VGLSVPFGLKTEYAPDWIGRFQAIKSEIDSLNVNPSVSYKVSEAVSLGLGVSYQTVSAEFTNAVNLVLAEGSADIKETGDAWGYNVGAMFQLAPDTRLGISYRSAISHHLRGSAYFSQGVPLPSGSVHTDIKLPDSASLALRHSLGPAWILLADATWTGWSKIQELNIKSDVSNASLSSTPENFRNTWRFGVGTTYRPNDEWSIKIGVAYDQTPVNDTDRTPRLPDQNRTWLSLGGQYRLSKDGTLDFGYSHLFVKDATINHANPGQFGGSLVGTYNASIDILGVQFAYRF
jgi:long-chain fatty acid transport protein